MVVEGIQLLAVAKQQMQHLGQTGLGLVYRLSQAWYKSALNSPAKSTANTYRYQTTHYDGFRLH